MLPHWKQPSHPNAVEVISQPGSYSSYSQAAASFEPGALLARLSAPTLTLSPRAYSSVQVGSNESIELNCDFLYINHSCEPNLEFHVLKLDDLNNTPNASSSIHHPYVIEIRVAERTDSQGKTIGLSKGEELSFFYPSTEWDMSNGGQPFPCKCKTSKCKGTIRGAKYLSMNEMKPYFTNKHILDLKEVQEKGETLNGGSRSGSGSGSESESGKTGGSSSPSDVADK